MSRKKQPSKEVLRVIPLGGLKEVGKNMTCYEYGDEIIVVDTGSMFPDDELLGVDIVIPDTTYLEKNFDKVKAYVYTHGHEDHIGAAPYVQNIVKAPIYATPFTAALLRHKFEEHGNKNVKIVEKRPGETFSIGSFEIEMIHVNHSIPDAVSLFIKTPAGTVLQTGDFKVDYNPVRTDIIDLARFGALGTMGVDLLLSDSTNVERAGSTMSESMVGITFDELFREIDGRIIVASFASNVARIQQVVNAAVVNHRKIAITGRSMNTIVNIAMNLGYLKLPPNDLIDISTINQYPDNEIVIMTTGSQGEPMAALTRMADKNHAQVEMKSGDVVILSSSPIPGNEKSVKNVINKLFELGVEVIYNQLADVHVSGHAHREELKLMLALVKPKYFMPVHGEYSMLRVHGDLAKHMGMNPNNVLLMDNGHVAEIYNHELKLAEPVPAGKVLIDGSLVGDVGSAVLRDRKQLSEDGLFMVILRMDSEDGKLLKDPDIISRGFVYMRESTDLIDEAKALITKTLDSLKPATRIDWQQVKHMTRNELSSFIYKKTKRHPMILIFILEV
ncbi:ribonuclease J [Guggenheimella bovis]